MSDKTTLQELADVARKLTAEDRQALARAGVVIPAVSADGFGGKNRCGYRCKYCGQIALEFVGDRFFDDNGEEVALPPTHQTIDQIAWCQPLRHPSEINRSRPLCQNCGSIVVLHGRNFILKYIVEIDTYLSGRDKAYREMRSKRGRRDAPLAVTNPDGSPVRMSQSYDADDQKLLEGTALPTQINKRTSEQVSAINQVAAETDLMQFLASGPSGRRTKK